MSPEPASGDPVEPFTPADAPGGPGGGPTDDPSAAAGDRHNERYGEVELARHRKEDGRAVILYSWQPHVEESR
jgi:hypothetical protein